MTKSAIEKQLLKDYPDQIIMVGKERCILFADVVQIVDNFLESVRINATEYWQPCVKAYFDWYKGKFGFNPDFKGGNPKHLKDIIEKLKKLAEENKIAWTEKNATGYLKKLLDTAYEDKWLKDNFLLRNINEHYTKIRANARKQKGESGDKNIGRISTKKIDDFLAE